MPSEASTASKPSPTWTLDPEVRHLNHGSFGAVPLAVQEEQERLRRLVESNPVRWFAALPERIAAARLDMAGLLAVDDEKLAFVLNASAGASVVYQALLDRGPVDVLVTDHGYGAVSMGARRLAARTGGSFSVLHIPLAASRTDVVDLVRAELTRLRPTLFVVDQITSATAREFDVEALCRLARELGVLTLVDGAHAPGVLADPVCREADYWVGNLHKFACAPRGAAVLVVRGDGQELRPLIDSWGAPLAFPERFDHNGTMDVTPWLTAPFAWRYLDETLGWATLRKGAGDLLDQACAVLAAALDTVVDDPLPDVGQPVGPLRLVRLPGDLGSTHDEADALRVPFGDATGIACAFTEFRGRGYLRLSAHAYNTIEDYQYLADVGIPLLERWSRQRVAPV